MSCSGPQEVAETITLVHQRGVVYQNTDNVMSAIDYHHLCERFVLPECADIVTRHLLREGKLAEATVQGNTQVTSVWRHRWIVVWRMWIWGYGE